MKTQVVLHTRCTMYVCTYKKVYCCHKKNILTEGIKTKKSSCSSVVILPCCLLYGGNNSTTTGDAFQIRMDSKVLRLSRRWRAERQEDVSVFIMWWAVTFDGVRDRDGHHKKREEMLFEDTSKWSMIWGGMAVTYVGLKRFSSVLNISYDDNIMLTAWKALGVELIPQLKNIIFENQTQTLAPCCPSSSFTRGKMFKLIVVYPHILLFPLDLAGTFRVWFCGWWPHYSLYSSILPSVCVVVVGVYLLVFVNSVEILQSSWAIWTSTCPNH